MIEFKKNFNLITNKIKADYLFKNSVFFFVNSIGVSGIGALFWMLAAQIFTNEEVGIFVILLSTSQLISTIAQMGLGFGLIRFYPLIDEPNQTEFLLNIVGFTTAFSIFLSLAVIIFGHIFSLSMNMLHNFLYGVSFFVLCITLTNNQIIYSYLSVVRKVDLLIKINFISGLGRIFFILIIWLVGISGKFIAIAYILPILFGNIFIFIKEFQKGFFGRRNKICLFEIFRKNGLFRYSFSNYLSNIFHDLPHQILPQIVANIFGFSTASYFYIVWNLYNFQISVSSSISQSFFVEGSNNNGTTKKKTLQSLMIAVGITLIISIFSILTSDIILSFFGKNYVINAKTFFIFISLSTIPVSGIYLLVSVFRSEKIINPILINYLFVFFSLMLFVKIVENLQFESIGICWLGVNLIALIYLVLKYMDLVKKKNLRMI